MWLAAAGCALAGNYSAALNDPTNIHDAPIPGFVGPDGEGNARLLQSGGIYLNPNNYVNPLFFGWAEGVVSYLPAPGVAGTWQQPGQTLGPVTGDHFHIATLGDLSASQIAGGTPPGSVSLRFAQTIRNRSGADFVVFENGAVSEGGAGVVGQLFGELAFVEVSSDGVQFARMPSRSLTPSPVGSYGTIDPTNVFGLAGKHANAYGRSWGTPFDLDWLAAHPLVTGGQLNLDAITHVRVVDIPGNRTFTDSLGAPIYDAWLTFGSGGFDLEAVGVLSRDMDFETWQDQRGLAGGQRGSRADPEGDGIPNLLEYLAALLPTGHDSPASVQSCAVEGGRLVLTFRRDERAVDLLVEVEASSDLHNWQVIARSSAGGPLLPVAPHAPVIEESSASPIASVGVIRRCRVVDVVTNPPRRFLRIRASLLP